MSEVATQKAASPVSTFSKTLERMKPQMALALPKHMSADRMARLALTAFSTNKALQQCKTDSILSSLMTATQLGLEPGINGQGYLIPYKDTCTFVPGWKGLVDLVSRAGRATVWTGAVYEGDHFDYQLGDEPFCRHKQGDSDGNFTHVYAIGRVKDAQMPVIEVWTRGKVKKHLDQYNKVGGRHYALASESNFEMYARKVALLQVLKYMPSSIELANAITVSHAAEAGQSATIEGDFVTVLTDEPDKKLAPSPELMSEANAAAAAGSEFYRKFWKEIGSEKRALLSEENDRLKDAAAEADEKKQAEKKSDAPIVTFASVMDKLVKAANLDALDVAADWIGEVSEPQHRAELTSKYESRRTELGESA